MKVALGYVRGGHVVMEGGGEPLPEGQRVTVLIEDEDGWVLDEAGTQDLIEAMAECDRGEVVPADEVLAALARKRTHPRRHLKASTAPNRQRR